ncbi:MAG: YHYH protein, partial [Bryobacteraceae bacterium]
MKPTIRRLLPVLAFATAAWGQCPTSTFLDVSKYAGAGAGYPKPTLEVTCENEQLVVRSNGIPHYEFVAVTPNALVASSATYRVPLKPQRAAEPTSIPLLGRAGFAVNGIAFFGPNEGATPAVERFGDPIYNAIMDECMGHTANEYHYHAFNQACLVDGLKDGQPSPTLGYALDNFPILGPWECAGADCTKVIRMKSSWDKTGDPAIKAWEAYTYVPKDGPEYLDRCNGHTDPKGDYHYHATSTFPYIIGCYAGVVTTPAAPGGG